MHALFLLVNYYNYYFIIFIIITSIIFIMFVIFISACTKANLSFSMKGHFPQIPEPEAMWDELLSFETDVALMPILPIFTPMLVAALDFHIGTFTRFVDNMYIDMILSQKKFFATSLFNLFMAFEAIIWYLIASSLASLVALTAAAKGTKTFRKIDFSAVVFFFVTTLFAQPVLRSRLHWLRLLVAAWGITCLFVQWLFADDMIAALTAGPGLDPIDDMDDLYRKSDKTITSFSALPPGEEEHIIEAFFPPSFEHRDEMSKRLKLFAAEKIFNLELVADLLYNVSQGISVHLSSRDSGMSYFKALQVDYLDKIYVSKEAGEVQPTFFLMAGPGRGLFPWRLNLMILHSQESGLYQLWVRQFTATFENVGDVDENVLIEAVGDEEGDIYHLTGSFVILGIGFGLAVGVAVCEQVGWFMARPRRQIAQNTGSWAQNRVLGSRVQSPDPDSLVLSPVPGPRYHMDLGSNQNHRKAPVSSILVGMLSGTAPDEIKTQLATSIGDQRRMPLLTRRHSDLFANSKASVSFVKQRQLQNQTSDVNQIDVNVKPKVMLKPVSKNEVVGKVVYVAHGERQPFNLSSVQ